MKTFEQLEAPKTFLPGVKAKHVVVSTACRTIHGDHGAMDEAIRRIKEEYVSLLAGWPKEKGATFHLVLTVDRNGRVP